jgi:hypothetical protein
MRKMASLPVLKIMIIQQTIFLETVQAKYMYAFIDFVYVSYEFYSIFPIYKCK